MSEVSSAVPELEERAKEVIQVIDAYMYHGMPAGKREPTLPTHSLVDLGLDSLDIVEVLMEVEDHFDIEIPDEHIPDDATINDLIKAVYAAFGDVYGEETAQA